MIIVVMEKVGLEVMSNEKRDRLKENISIIKRHNDTGIPVVSLTNRNKFEVQVIDEIIEDVSLVIEKMENKTLIEIPESGIGDLSDGYHTFNELYHHRAVLFSVICNLMPERAWKSKLHDTGDMFEGMFIVGIETPDGPATYHYDINPYWDMFKVQELEKAPKWDGHTSADAINRIATFFGNSVEMSCGGKDCNHNVVVCYTRDIKGSTNMFYTNETDCCSDGESRFRSDEK